MRRYWTVSSCRGRRGTSLFSRKIHRYFFLSVYFDGFHRANANRCWLISKKSSECEWTRVAILLFIYLYFFLVFSDRLFIQNYSFGITKYRYRTSMNPRWILQHFPASWKRFRVVEQTLILNMKLTNYFTVAVAKITTAVLSFSDNKIRKNA